MKLKDKIQRLTEINKELLTLFEMSGQEERINKLFEESKQLQIASVEDMPKYTRKSGKKIKKVERNKLDEIERD